MKAVGVHRHWSERFDDNAKGGSHDAPNLYQFEGTAATIGSAMTAGVSQKEKTR
jgi:hypothetical protein